MAGDDGRRRRSRHAAAVLLVLCALAQSLTCFTLRGLSKTVKLDEVARRALLMEVKRGSSLLNGEELVSHSAATGNDGLLHIDSDQSDGTEMLEQTSQLGDNMADEAAWRRLNCSLHCRESKMKLRAMGPGAADLKLDMGNARPLPLTQVPESCGYSTQQNALGLVLVVPYDGCNVMQEDGNYVLQMNWLETPVEFTCPMLRVFAPVPASTPPTPAQQPWTLPFPLGPNRHKRHATQPLSVYDPSSAYYSYLYYCYYMNMMTPAPTPGATTTTTDAAAATTAKPDTTIVTTKPSVEKSPPEHPYYYYPYYFYYPYHQYPYYTLPNIPVKTTTAKPTTAKPATTTTGPVTTVMATIAKMTTAEPVITTNIPQKTPEPYYPSYYPFYPPAGQPGVPIYYYPFIQHFYGMPPFPQNPSNPMQTTPPPSLTTVKPGKTVLTVKPITTIKPGKTIPSVKPITTIKPGKTVPTVKPITTVKPGKTVPTVKPITTVKPGKTVPTVKLTSKPTTVSAPTPETTTPCPYTTKPSSGSYPGPLIPYVPYHQHPFAPYLSYNKAGKLPVDQKYMHHASYKSGLEPRAHPHPGFNYWQPVPWFPDSTGKDNLQFDWNK